MAMQTARQAQMNLQNSSIQKELSSESETTKTGTFAFKSIMSLIVVDLIAWMWTIFSSSAFGVDLLNSHGFSDEMIASSNNWCNSIFYISGGTGALIVSYQILAFAVPQGLSFILAYKPRAFPDLSNRKTFVAFMFSLLAIFALVGTVAHHGNFENVSFPVPDIFSIGRSIQQFLREMISGVRGSRRRALAELKPVGCDQKFQLLECIGTTEECLKEFKKQLSGMKKKVLDANGDEVTVKAIYPGDKSSITCDANIKPNEPGACRNGYPHSRFKMLKPGSPWGKYGILYSGARSCSDYHQVRIHEQDAIWEKTGLDLEQVEFNWVQIFEQPATWLYNHHFVVFSYNNCNDCMMIRVDFLPVDFSEVKSYKGIFHSHDARIIISLFNGTLDKKNADEGGKIKALTGKTMKLSYSIPLKSLIGMLYSANYPRYAAKCSWDNTRESVAKNCQTFSDDLFKAFENQFGGDHSVEGNDPPSCTNQECGGTLHTEPTTESEK